MHKYKNTAASLMANDWANTHLPKFQLLSKSGTVKTRNDFMLLAFSAAGAVRTAI